MVLTSQGIPVRMEGGAVGKALAQCPHSVLGDVEVMECPHLDWALGTQPSRRHGLGGSRHWSPTRVDQFTPTQSWGEKGTACTKALVLEEGIFWNMELRVMGSGQLVKGERLRLGVSSWASK